MSQFHKGSTTTAVHRTTGSPVQTSSGARPDTAGQARRPGARPRWDTGTFISTYGTVVVLALIVIVFALLSDRFLSMANLINVLRQVSTLAIVSTGLTIAIASGEFDLSVGMVASLAGIIVSGMMVRQELPVGIALAGALGVGVAFGTLNGALVTRARIPSLITTLGTSAVALGVNFAYARGDSIYGRMPRLFSYIGQGFIGPIPFSVILALLIMALAYFMLNHTYTGRYIVATGGNITAARLSGIDVNRYRLYALLTCGVLAALGGIVLTSYLGTGQPTGAEPYTLDGLAAVFLGMTTIRPGRANVLGTLVGVLILGVVNNGLNLVGAPFYLQNIVRGGMLVASVSLAVWREEIRFF